MARPKRSDQLQGPAVDVCDDRVVHVEDVRAARETLPSAVELEYMADLFAALSDPTRIRLLAALNSRELCVCDLAAVVGQTESAVSHQLRVLRDLRLVRSRRDGRRVYYALDDAHVETLYAQALDHMQESDR